VVVWGSDSRSLNLGRLDERECAACGRAQPFQLSLAYKYFHLYWIFRWVKEKKYWATCVVCEQKWELQASKVELALGNSSIPLWDRYGLAVFGVAAVGLIAVAAANVPPPADRDQAGLITGEGELDAFRIRVGDCFNDDLPLSAQPQEVTGIEVTAVDGVPCPDPHDNEAYAVFDMSLEEFPVQDQVVEIAMDSCLERFQPFVGREYETSVLDVVALYPTSESWARRADREVICAVSHVDGRKLTGTMEASGL
jgi:hypothetical protein